MGWYTMYHGRKPCKICTSSQLKTECLSVWKYLHIIFGMAPVSLGVQIAQTEALQLPKMDLRHRATDLPSYKIWTWKNMYTQIWKKLVWSIYSALSFFFALIVFFSPFIHFLYLSISFIFDPTPPYTCQCKFAFWPKRIENYGRQSVLLAHTKAETHTNSHTQG